MDKNARFRWVVSIEGLTTRQRWASLGGLVFGLTCGRVIADRYAYNFAAEFALSMVLALICYAFGLALTGRNPFVIPKRKN